MHVMVNAWLERKDPILELRDTTTNREILSVKGKKLRDWLDDGEIAISDLSDYAGTREMIKQLLLKSLITTAPATKSKDAGLGKIISFPILKRLISHRNRYDFSKDSKIIYMPPKNTR